jgi:hypothetical protein
MGTKNKKQFDTVEFFRAIKLKLAKKLSTMTLQEQKEFLKLVGEGKIELT